MPKIIGKLNQRFPFLKNYYYDHYATMKHSYLFLRHRMGILVPEWVQWLVTYNCNLRCKHCEASTGQIKVEEVTTKQICSAIDDMDKMEMRFFSFSGGEPLLRKDLFEVVKYVRDKEIGYGIASNCYLLEKYVSDFEKYVPSRAFTSIDGLEQSHDKFRGRDGAFKKVLDALKFFKKIGSRRITVNTFVYPGNLYELPDLLPIISNSGATNWRLAIAIPVGRAKSNHDMYLTNDQIEHLFKFIHKARKKFDVHITEDAGYLGCLDRLLKTKPFFCGAGLTRCAIMPDGEVLGCQIAYDNRYSEGNIKEKPFREIWQKGFSRFRTPSFDGCAKCKHFHACRAGCWGMRLGNKHCLKETWENNEFCSQICT